MSTLGSIAVGAKIKVTHSVMGDIVFLKADKDHSGYPSNSTTLIAEKILLHRAFDATEPSNSDSDRRNYGNNKYSLSNIDQWLNSEAAAGAWYSARHSADHSPDSSSVVSRNPYSSDAGFLNGFDADFVAALKDTTLKVVLNTVTDGGSYETVTRKMFLASNTEVGLSNENSIAEGSLLAIFSAGTNACRIAYTSAYASWDNAAKGGSAIATGSAYYWWLRTPCASVSYGVRYVSSGGTLDYFYASNGSRGVRPLCNLDSDISVSDTTDSDGCYTLILTQQGISAPELTVQETIYCDPTYETGGATGGTAAVEWSEVSGASGYSLERSINGGDFAEVYSGANRTYTETVLSTMQSLQYRARATDGTDYSEYATSAVRVIQDNYPPFISGDETNLGEKAFRFSHKYTLYDGDDISLTVKEYINATLIREYTTNTGVEQTLEISSENWGACLTGDNYIRIEATDDNSATVTQTKHFTKLAGVLTVNYCPTGNTLTQPKAINVELDLEKPFSSNIQVLACNNGNDTQPVYDDITTAVRAGINHIFTNTAKENGVTYWKVIINVNILRNGADGDIKLKGIKAQLDATVS